MLCSRGPYSGAWGPAPAGPGTALEHPAPLGRLPGAGPHFFQEMGERRPRGRRFLPLGTPFSGCLNPSGGMPWSFTRPAALSLVRRPKRAHRLGAPERGGGYPSERDGGEGFQGFLYRRVGVTLLPSVADFRLPQKPEQNPIIFSPALPVKKFLSPHKCAAPLGPCAQGGAIP